jgi:5-methylcytosine-specific restriction endonuclease McrA
MHPKFRRMTAEAREIHRKQKNREAQARHRAKMSPEERKAFDKAKYLRNKGRYNAQARAWGIANREKSQASTHQVTTRKNYPEAFSKTDIDTKELAKYLLEHRGRPCPFCGFPSTHLDHKLPLSRGGSHTWDNIWMICKTCNLAKNGQTVKEYVLWIQGLIKNIQNLGNFPPIPLSKVAQGGNYGG